MFPGVWCGFESHLGHRKNRGNKRILTVLHACLLARTGQMLARTGRIEGMGQISETAERTHPCFARDPLTPARESRFWAKVAKTATCWEWTGVKRKSGYGEFSICCKMLAAHRVSYELAKGPIPEGMVIDHMCHNTSCVNPEHLRACTQKQNRENQQGADIRSKTGTRGVGRLKTGRFSVRVGHNGVVQRHGSYDTLEEAEAVAIRVRNDLFTHNIERLARG